MRLKKLMSQLLKTLSFSPQMRQRLGATLSLVLCLLAFMIIVKEFQRTDWSIVFASIKHISGFKIAQSCCFVCLSYGAIACYDVLAFYHLKYPLSIRKSAFVGLITYTISPNVGFAFLSGSVLRYRLYRHWHVSPLDIAQVIAFTNLSLWVGLVPIAGIVLTFSHPTLPQAIALPFVLQSLKDLGIFLLIISVLYLGFLAIFRQTIKLEKYRIKLPGLKITFQQVLVFSMDWGCASLALYTLFDLPISYPTFFGIYVIAMVSGLISTVPGGLGIFETVILFFLEPLQRQEILLGVLLVFRSLYYFLPFVMAVMALLIFEAKQQTSA